MFRSRPGVVAIIEIAFLLILLFLPAVTFAQQQDETLSPLRPTDTSSPRSTLRSFLESTDTAIGEWKSQGITPAFRDALFTSLGALDLTNSPNESSWSQQLESVLLLKEILDRVTLPPWHEIPGANEVERDQISEWIIPGTKLRIALVDSGYTEGEYRFSADTIDRLEQFYRRIKEEPYRPGATENIYEDYLALDQTTQVGRSAEFQSRLKGADNSSPRATLDNFLSNVNAAYDKVMEVEKSMTSSPPTMTIGEARELEREAAQLLARAADSLDLSKVPEVLLGDVSIESVLQLKEIIDRDYLPPIESIPDLAMVEQMRQNVSGPISWRFPSTEIDIIEIIDGRDNGEFLFSADTVQRIAEYYEKVKDIQYRDPQITLLELDYISPHTSDGFFEYYITTPGNLTPHTNFLGRLINSLPSTLKLQFAGQAIWQWVGFVVSGVVVFGLGYAVFKGFAWLATLVPVPFGHWISVLAPLTFAGLVSAALVFVDKDLNLTGKALYALTTLDSVIILFMLAFAAWRALAATAETIIVFSRFVEGGVDASLIRILTSIVAVFCGGWILLDGLQKLGAEVLPLLAGLGVGGLAVALAIRPTLENLIGGLILYIDKPVRVGDYCSFGTYTGTVENIGIRSTQLRGLDRTITTVPNAKFADMEIVNWARCDQMMIDTTLGLRYETKPDQLRYVLAKMREMFVSHPSIDRSTVRVRFVGYGSSSLDVAIRVYAQTRDWNDYFAIREDVFLRISDIVSDAGTNFAVPSQTLYMGRDSGLDLERSIQASQEVKAWRRQGRLPFPYMSKQRMESLEGKLTYPPRGSVDSPQDMTPAEPLSAETEDQETEQPLSEAQQEDRQKKDT